MAKNRGLKNRTAISNSIENNLYDNFIKLHKQTRISQSKLLDEAIELLLAKYDIK